jgi:hypothetical protein
MMVPNSVPPGVPSGGVPANGGGDALPYQPPINSAPNTGGGGEVPDYDYDDVNPGADSETNFNVPVEPLGANPVEPLGANPVEPLGANEKPADVELSRNEIPRHDYDDDDFVEPITVQPASSTSDFDGPPSTAATSRPDPYMYDKQADDFNGDGIAETYEWLRGVLDFDDQRREWQITYNADPTDKNDKYGGTFTLSNDEGIYDLELVPDDVVLIDGRVDIEKVNHQGKPTYRVESVKRLEPER